MYPIKNRQLRIIGEGKCINPENIPPPDKFDSVLIKNCGIKTYSLPVKHVSSVHVDDCDQLKTLVENNGLLLLKVSNCRELSVVTTNAYIVSVENCGDGNEFKFSGDFKYYVNHSGAKMYAVPDLPYYWKNIKADLYEKVDISSDLYRCSTMCPMRNSPCDKCEHCLQCNKPTKCQKCLGKKYEECLKNKGYPFMTYTQGEKPRLLIKHFCDQKCLRKAYKYLL